MSRVVIVGAGPGGATLAYLLARNGVEVTLLERHLDFRREFRGEVLMPSGLEPFAQMDLWDALDALPHVGLAGVEVFVKGRSRFSLRFDPEDFGRYAPRWISQPALLEMLVERAARHPSFRLERGASVSGLLEDAGRFVGVRARIDGDERELRADLVVGADGRGSMVRRRAELPVSSDPTPMDIVWCKIPMLRALQETGVFRGYLGNGHLLIAVPVYDGKLQMAWIIPKGTYREVRERGMAACLDEMANHVNDDLAAHLRAHRNDSIEPFLLSTVSDRVGAWTKPGVLVIGDAAHTMSPVGAQGINIAIRDAVVAANRLVPVLTKDAAPARIDAAARAVQSEREPEVQWIQRAQAVPPRVILRNTWWANLVLAVLPRLAATPIGAARARSLFRRFAFGLSEVRLEV